MSKHDGIQNYTTSLNPADWSRQVPVGQLAADLRGGNVPRFSYVVPDECHDMHGDPPYCLDSGNIGDPQNQHLVAVGDAYLGQLVSEITHAPFWAQGNNAIAITYDNGDNAAGCCDAKPGGGRIATVVVTSHGPRGARDAQPANHYSLLSTIQRALGVGCLAHTCDTRHVRPLAKLFAVTGSASIATTVRPERRWPTPTPSPREPRSRTRATTSAGGWTVQRAGGSAATTAWAPSPAPRPGTSGRSAISCRTRRAATRTRRWASPSTTTGPGGQPSSRLTPGLTSIRSMAGRPATAGRGRSASG